MTPKQFDQLVKAHRIRRDKTIKACRAVLVDGMSAYAAARKYGLNESIISRALAKLRRPRCPTCGQPLKEKE